MTPAETLRAAAEADDEAAVRALLADLPEAERAELAPVARPIVAAVKRQGIAAVGHLGTTMLAGVRRAAGLGHPEAGLAREPPAAGPRGRPSPTIGGAAPSDHRFPVDEVGPGVAIVRALVREGTVPRPDRPSYTIAMLAATR